MGICLALFKSKKKENIQNNLMTDASVDSDDLG